MRRNDRMFMWWTYFALSTLAKYITVSKTGDAAMQAKVIKFYPLRSTVVLERDVIVTQGENSFHGPTIIYTMKDQLVSVPASKTGRATITIEPDKIKS